MWKLVNAMDQSLFILPTSYSQPLYFYHTTNFSLHYTFLVLCIYPYF